MENLSRIVHLPQPLLSRLAPTPSGLLHEGNAFSFLLTAVITKSYGGRLLLRIDDIDASRKRPEYLSNIFYTLDWLGIQCDIGPESPDDFEQQWSQHHRLNSYHHLLALLAQRPDTIYDCPLSRQEIQQLIALQADYPTGYRDFTKPLSTPDTAWRLAIPDRTLVSWLDADESAHVVDLAAHHLDPVVRRRDSLPAYQIASLADDLYFGVNFIVRGRDLIPSTAVQRYLAQLLQLDAFLNAAFLHHPLLLDDKGGKLSKSAGAAALQSQQEQSSPHAIYQRIAAYLLLPDDAADSLSTLVQAYQTKHGLTIM